MTWVKLDDAFHRNPKVRAAGLRGRALYIAGLCYCAAELTDGIIVKSMLPVIAAEADVKPTEARTLVTVGLWLEQPDAYLVNDYLAWNPSAEKVRATRKARSEAGARGGQRSGQVRGTKGEPNDEANASPNGEAKTKPTRTPSPSPVPSAVGCSVVVKSAPAELDGDDILEIALEAGLTEPEAHAQWERMLDYVQRKQIEVHSWRDLWRDWVRKPRSVVSA